MRHIVLFLAFVSHASFSETEEQASCSIRSLDAFFPVLFEQTDESGRYLKPEPPVFEYRHMRNISADQLWDSDGKLDLVVAVSCTSAPKSLELSLATQFKVGTLIVNEEYGVTDVQAGLSTSRWGDVIPLSHAKIDEVNGLQNHFARNIDIRSWISSLYETGDWAYRVRFIATLEAAGSNLSEKSMVIEISPGD